jgi:two-component system OmpR family response regulator
MNSILENPHKETTAPPNGVEGNRSPRIMVVEDDVHLRDLSTEALAREGYQVDVAENGIRAWKALHLKRYDLLITDNSMPRMSGLQLVRKLRSAGIELPVVLASGSRFEDAVLKDATLNFAAVIPKPFTLDDLIATVKKVLVAPACNYHNADGSIDA